MSKRPKWIKEKREALQAKPELEPVAHADVNELLHDCKNNPNSTIEVVYPMTLDRWSEHPDARLRCESCGSGNIHYHPWRYRTGYQSSDDVVFCHDCDHEQKPWRWLTKEDQIHPYGRVWLGRVVIAPTLEKLQAERGSK